MLCALVGGEWPIVWLFFLAGGRKRCPFDKKQTILFSDRQEKKTGWKTLLCTEYSLLSTTFRDCDCDIFCPIRLTKLQTGLRSRHQRLYIRHGDFQIRSDNSGQSYNIWRRRCRRAWHGRGLLCNHACASCMNQRRSFVRRGMEQDRHGYLTMLPMRYHGTCMSNPARHFTCSS